MDFLLLTLKILRSNRWLCDDSSDEEEEEEEKKNTKQSSALVASATSSEILPTSTEKQDSSESDSDSNSDDDEEEEEEVWIEMVVSMEALTMISIRIDKQMSVTAPWCEVNTCNMFIFVSPRWESVLWSILQIWHVQSTDPAPNVKPSSVTRMQFAIVSYFSILNFITETWCLYYDLVVSNSSTVLHR